MPNSFRQLFSDSELAQRIRERLPRLFQIAELESSRAGKIGMQVGSLREKILIAMLIYKFGEENVETEIKITEPEVDVKLFDNSISIKTITGKSFGGVKIIWTVDRAKAIEFLQTYHPVCDILFTQIIWGETGGLLGIPLQVQIDTFNKMGGEGYIKLPKPGTNPRGVELSKEAMSEMINDNRTNVIDINWKKADIDFNPYQKWVDYWSEESQ